MGERCEDCNRWKVTAKQFEHWWRWSQRHVKWTSDGGCYPRWRKAWSWLTQPWWWRLDTTCLQWHDCPASYPPGYRYISPVIVRLFRVRFTEGEPRD